MTYNDALIETVGPFRLYPPDSGATGWGISYNEVWLPVILADRDACLIVAGMILADVPDEPLKALWEQYNQADPSVPIAVDHILEHMAETDDEDDE